MKKFIPTKFYGIAQKIKLSIIEFTYFVFSKFPLKNRVIFYSSGKEMKGNIKAIHAKLELPSIFVPNVTKKIIKKIRLIILIAQSKYTIVDDYVPFLYSIKFRKNAKFIQVWHAGGAFKNVGFSRLNKEGGPKKTAITHKNYTDVIVSSDTLIDIYSHSFGIEKNKIKAIGLPRTDIFFDDDFLNPKKDYSKKIILYTPTFRGNGFKSAYFENNLNFKKLYEKFKDEYVFLISMHPFVKDKINIPEEYKDFFIDITEKDEINNILPYVDILITDYSSIIFEYLYFKKPIIFFVPDLDDYEIKRGFYFNFEDYNYGTISKNNDELIDAIDKKYINLKKLEKIKTVHMNKCDGHATERFLKEVIKG